MTQTSPHSAGAPSRPDRSQAEIHTGLFPALALWFRVFGYSLPAGLQVLLVHLVGAGIVAATLGATTMAYLYLHKYAAAGLMVVCLVAMFFLWFPYAGRTMFRLTAGHVAVFTESILTGRVETGGRGLFAHGRGRIERVFGPREVFHSFHTDIDRILAHLVRSLDRVDDQVPQLGWATRWIAALRSLIQRHMTFVVISYALAGGAQSGADLQRRSLEATCLVMQNGFGLLRTAVFAAILERLVSAVAWLVLGLALTALLYVVGHTVVFQLPVLDFEHPDPRLLENVKFWYCLVFALVAGPSLGGFFAWMFLESVWRPIATAMVLLKFHHLTRNQPLQGQWVERIQAGAIAMDRLDWLSFRVLGP